ncbi:sporulation protein YpjB [Neobacillus mesonae]|nr:sporulation protein YpjB [Neobacillus mesonae]
MFSRKKRSSCMVLSILYCTLLGCVLYPGVTAASGQVDSVNSNSAQELNQAATSLYRKALDNDLSGVREEIQSITTQVERLSFNGLTSVEGMHALTETIVEVKEASSSVQNASDSLQHASAKLRLAVDSIAHQDKPLWLQYYKILKEDLAALGEEAQMERTDSLIVTYGEFEQHYETIRPAAIIKRQPYEIERFDSWMSYLKGLTMRSNPESQDIMEALKQGDEFVNALFGREKDETAFTPFADGPEPWAAQLFIGSSIVAVLAYVGYRKFKGTETASFIK